MSRISEEDARRIARPFGEAAAGIVAALRQELAGDPLDEIERQLDALIDGAPLRVGEFDITRVRALAREIAGNAFISTLQATRQERVFCVEMHDHVDAIVQLHKRRA